MNLIEKVVKPEIKQLVRIKDSFDDRYDYLRLDKNERLLPFSKKDLHAFQQSLTSEDLSGYYELGPVYRRLAQYLHVNENQLHLAAGSDLGIKSVFEACVSAGDNVVLHAPSYAMYRIYAKMFGAEPRMVPMLSDWSADIDGMLRQVDDRTKIMALENPNGFVGTTPSREAIETCARELLKRNVLLLVDEAYHYVENTECSNRDLIAKYPNVILSQTLSKAHGLAGARVGYVLGEEHMMEHIRRVRPMHEISSLAACATLWILNNPAVLDEFQASISESKGYLKEELKRLDISVRDTHANFMLFYFPNEGRTNNMEARLKKHKILIRRPFEEPALKGWSRVCVGSKADSERLVQAIKAEL